MVEDYCFEPVRLWRAERMDELGRLRRGVAVAVVVGEPCCGVIADFEVTGLEIELPAHVTQLIEVIAEIAGVVRGAGVLNALRRRSQHVGVYSVSKFVW